MNDFVWILPADKNTSFGKHGVSGSYIIPKGDIKVSPNLLSGQRLWVLLRDQDDRVLLSIKIKKIEKIIDGYYNEDFLASVDLLSSFRLVSRYFEASKYIVKSTASFSTGISEIKQDDANRLSQIVRQNIEVKLAKPNTSLFSGMNTKILPRTGQSLAKAAVRMTVSHLNLNDIWASGTGKKLGAFSNFANDLIMNSVGFKKTADIENILKLFDPLLNLGEDQNTRPSTPIKASSPKVDIDFSEVDPEKIHARKFISFGNKFKDLETALSKTEHAEKIHQEMLKDISTFLISKGITPYESGSIDLMFMATDIMEICEIKSTTTDNILAQSSKGAFQLACYMDELVKQYDTANSRLILRTIENEEIETYVTKILLTMNIKVLFYNPNKSWPNKIKGFI